MHCKVCAGRICDEFKGIDFLLHVLLLFGQLACRIRILANQIELCKQGGQGEENCVSKCVSRQNFSRTKFLVQFSFSSTPRKFKLGVNKLEPGSQKVVLRSILKIFVRSTILVASK